jgi:acyl carrier protein
VKPAELQTGEIEMTTLELLTPIFRQVFDDDGIVLTRETTADDIDAWDSLSHMNLVVAVEMIFKVRFALGELQTLKNVGHLVDMIDKKLKK